MGAVAFETKSAHIGEVAFPTTFGDGDDVVSIPERFTSAQIPVSESAEAGRSTQALDVMELSGAIESTDGTHAAIAFENPLAEMAGIAAKLPLFDAPIRAKSETARRDFQLAPAAETAAVRAFGQRGAIGAAAGDGALSAHANRIAATACKRKPNGKALTIVMGVTWGWERGREGGDCMRIVQACLVGTALLLSSVIPVGAQDQRRSQDRGNSSYQNRGNDNRGNNQGRSNYYGGMNEHVRGGNYGQAIQRDENQHHHDSGGIGPGKAALIGGAGGAALGAIFGGGLKGTLIGGAAGAGIGAIGGKLAQGHDDHRGRD